jgi:hypothetical protein
MVEEKSKQETGIRQEATEYRALYHRRLNS